MLGQLSTTLSSNWDLRLEENDNSRFRLLYNVYSTFYRIHGGLSHRQGPVLPRWSPCMHGVTLTVSALWINT